MIVTFDPAITGGTYSTANNDAYYVNFLRCVTAIATANAGTTSLTVNPYTSINTVDGTRNCIVSIIANTEGGGWLTSPNTHSIPIYPASFTSMTSRTSYATMFKADFYNESGKAGMPFEKMTFHAIGHNSTGSDNHWNGKITTAPLTAWNTTNGGQLQYTFGCSTTIDGDAGYVPAWSGITPNQQSTSFTMNGYHSNVAGSAGSDGVTTNYPGPAAAFNLNNVASVTYTMAVTANYCIIWENHKSNSYAAGYSNTYTTAPGGSTLLYGGLMYGGVRTAQPWEETIGNNPPWVAWNVAHQTPIAVGTQYNSISNSMQGPSNSGTNNWTATQPNCPNGAAAYMTTSNNSGILTTTASRMVNYPSFQYWRNIPVSFSDSVSGTGYQTAAGRLDSYMHSAANGQTELDLVTPLFHHRQRKSVQQNGILSTTHSPNLPTIDSQTGTFVPGAYPIKIQRTKNDSWNAGGDCKGIFKSLSMPLAQMKLYWQDGQTFTVNGEVYMPIVFNEDMYLIRKA